MKQAFTLLSFLAATAAAASAAGMPVGTAAAAARLSSVSRLAFGPGNVLFAADWKAGKVFALSLPPAAAPTNKPFNLTALGASLAELLGTRDLRIESTAMRPNSDEAYVSVQVGKNLQPAIVVAKPDGSVKLLDLATTHATAAALEKPADALTFWNKIPENAYTVTDMKWHGDRLYVAGLANQRFASTLRILSYPFGSQKMASIEMYHTAHDQLETRAPIRAMTFANLNGRDTLLAAYLCSPLVAIPVASLHDGAHVKATSLSELGVAGIPVNMFVYDAPTPEQKMVPTVFVNEQYRPSLAIPLANIAKAYAAGGMTKPIDMMKPPAGGSEVGAVPLPLAGVLSAADQNARFVVTLRRDLATGDAQLVSYDKSAFFRISDYKVSEYQFPDYVYTPGLQQKYILPAQNGLKTEEGYPDLVRGAK